MRVTSYDGKAGRLSCSYCTKKRGGCGKWIFNRPATDLQPDAQPTNRRVSGKSYKPETDNTRKSKFSRNKTSTYSARNGGLSPLHSWRSISANVSSSVIHLTPVQSNAGNSL